MKIHIAHGRLTTRSATANRGRDAAVFSLSSGALGIRGELEEDSFQSGAAILSGFFDREPIVYGENAYGYPQYNEFSVYAPNALGFRLFWEGEEVRPGGGSVTGFEQTLDTGDGTVSHRYTALGPGGARLRVSFQRCVPLDCPGLLVIRCRAQPCGESGGLNIRAYLSPGGGAEQTSSDPRKCSAAQGVDTQFRAEGERLVCVKTLTRSGNTAAAAAQCAGNGRFEGAGRDDRGIYAAYSFQGVAELTKYVVYHRDEQTAVQTLQGCLARPVQEVFSSHAAALRARYDRVGLEAEGGELGTLIRYSILQLIMAAPAASGSIPAKGLTGLGYSGHIFWDTEMYLFPFYLYNFPATAKKLLRFRFDMLDEVRARAAQLSYRGALFPWRTLSGRECSAYFPAGTAEFHINGDIAYAADAYLSATGDTAFLTQCALEMMLETARFYLSLGFFHEDGSFRINGATGPDEYSALVNNNLYTNLMARHNFLCVLKWLDFLGEADRPACGAFWARHRVTSGELDQFRRAAEHIKLCKSGDLLLQDENILNLEELDLSAVPEENFPLLLHYHPLFLYQKRVCKQADAVMAMVLFPDLFTPQERAASFAFYDRITSHDSSLSRGVFSIAALDLGDEGAAAAFLEQSLRLDIDGLHHNAEAGLHFANLGLAWLMIVRGLFGFRLRDGAPSFSPKRTALLNRCAFNLCLGRSRINVRLAEDGLWLRLTEGDPVCVSVDGRQYRLADRQAIRCAV